MKVFPLVLCFLTLVVLRPCQTVLVDPEDETECEEMRECPPIKALSNVALKKSAKQSSTFLDFGAEKAVDGKSNRWFWDGSTCTHTSETGDKLPWLTVDLQGPHAVHSVSIVSRADPCCADRYHDIEVRVGDKLEKGLNVKFDANPVCAELVKGGKPGEIFNLTCSPCLIGRYVSVQITKLCSTCMNRDVNILTLCELEIYGEKLL